MICVVLSESFECVSVESPVKNDRCVVFILRAAPWERGQLLTVSSTRSVETSRARNFGSCVSAASLSKILGDRTNARSSAPLLKLSLVIMSFIEFSTNALE